VALLALLADPKATQARIADLKTAEANANQQIEQATARERNAAVALKAAKDQSDTLDRRLAEYNAELAAFKTSKLSNDSAMAGRDQNLSAGEADLAKRKSEFDQREGDTNASLIERDRQLKARELAAEQRDATLRDWQTRLERKERALKSAMADA
jgi:chromosome segregation ATPase